MNDSHTHTLYCGNLSDEATEELLYELFLQAGPISKVTIPKDKNGKQRAYGFITFKHDVSVPYAMQLMSSELLFGRQLRLQTRDGGGGGAESPAASPSPSRDQLSGNDRMGKSYGQFSPPFNNVYNGEPAYAMDNRNRVCYNDHYRSYSQVPYSNCGGSNYHGSNHSMYGHSQPNHYAEEVRNHLRLHRSFSAPMGMQNMSGSMEYDLGRRPAYMNQRFSPSPYMCNLPGPPGVSLNGYRQ